MKHINESYINELLYNASKASPARVDQVLAKSMKLQRLNLDETAVLLAVRDPEGLGKIFAAAARVKDAIYGKRVVLFAPLYISNRCVNNCAYCSFKSDNRDLPRKELSIEEIREEVSWLLKRGHKRILAVAGESRTNADYYVRAVKAIYSVAEGPHRIKRVNINCAPLSQEEFRKLKGAGIGTYQLFQETYHEKTYRRVHPSGPKSDPDNRIDAIERAFRAGIDDVGIGVLFGLADFRFEVLAMLMHIEYLEKVFNIGPHTISVPRIEPAQGADLAQAVPHPISDEDFRKVVAVLRLAVPYTGIILSTRETPAMRDGLFNLGVSQASAGSKTSPGGYAAGDETGGPQFSLNDHRSLDEVIGSLLRQGHIPSFCAACYRAERTGETFMNLAKPGTIKGKCNINALVTLKEYLDDFAPEPVKHQGYALIKKVSETLDEPSKKQLTKFFTAIDRGIRDTYI